MYSVKVEAEFSSAHNLRGYKGKCEALHGHNWKVEAVASARDLDKSGMLLDFHLLKKQLRLIIDKLDHKHLNQIPYFKKTNPTSENICRYIFDALKPRVSALKSITVWESASSCATYEAQE